METSAIMIAKVMGPFLIILGIWFLFCKEFLSQLVVSGRGVLYLGGVINVLLGLIIITSYNVWNWNIFIFVTLLGWAALLRGLYMLFTPDNFMDTKQVGGFFLKIYGILPLIWGIILTWIAYK